MFENYGVEVTAKGIKHFKDLGMFFEGLLKFEIF